MRDLGERLEDILEAIGHIERYAARGRAAFENDELIQNWFVRHLQIIGEAVRALSDEVHNAEPEIPWSKIIGMRHILVHDYFSIDTETVWSAIERDLPVPRTESTAMWADPRADLSFTSPRSSDARSTGTPASLANTSFGSGSRRSSAR